MPADIPPGDWRQLKVDLRIDGVVRRVTILALYEEEAPAPQTFTVINGQAIADNVRPVMAVGPSGHGKEVTVFEVVK